MGSILLGLLVTAASGLLLYAFSPSASQVRKRSDWVEVTIAIGFTLGSIMGIALVVVGVGGLF